MPDYLTQLGTDAPYVAAIISVVIIFIKYLQKKDDSQERREVQRDQMFKELNKENTDARNHSREVIEKNTVAAIHSADAMHEMTNVMRKIIESNGHHFKKESH